MCTTCGCGSTEHDHDHDHDHHHDHAHDGPVRRIQLERELLAKNAQHASANRRAAARDRVAIFNLIGSPGAGKTALLEALVRTLVAEMPWRGGIRKVQAG